MVTSQECIKKFGDPTLDQRKWEMANMILHVLDVRIHSANGVIPSKIYVNKAFAKTVEAWLLALVDGGVIGEILSWDGCFNVRLKRGLRSLSLHSFACAVDINAAQNPLGLTEADCVRRGLKPFSKKFIEISRKFMECGADWVTRPDGMHFQIKTLA